MDDMGGIIIVHENDLQKETLEAFEWRGSSQERSSPQSSGEVNNT